MHCCLRQRNASPSLPNKIVRSSHFHLYAIPGYSKGNLGFVAIYTYCKDISTDAIKRRMGCRRIGIGQGWAGKVVYIVTRIQACHV
nr:MAG TPA: hypothetical protein [Bacteriophage sp.]